MAVISVIIVNWNSGDTIFQCLESLPQDELDIIVIDNGSTDGSPELIQKDFPGIQLHRNMGNLGFAKAVNQGIAFAKGELILLLNPDARIDAISLEHLKAKLLQEQSLAVIGPRLINSDGSLQPSGRYFPSLFRTWIEGFLWASIKKSQWWQLEVFGRIDFTIPAQVDEVSGACFLTRKSTFDKVGLLDEQFFLFYEETDWFKRLGQAGGTVFYEPQAQVQHYWGTSMAKQHNSAGMYYESRFRYWQKYKGWIGNVAARFITLVHIVYWMEIRILATLFFIKKWSELKPALKEMIPVIEVAISPLSLRDEK